MARKRKPRGGKLRIILGCIIIVLLGAAGLGIFVFDNFEPDAADETQGSGASQVAGTPASGSSASAGASSGVAGPSKGEKVYGAMKSAYYSRSGNSLGNLYTVEALCADDGDTIVRVRESEVHSDPIKTQEFHADDDLLDQIEAIVDHVGIKDWGELPRSEFIALDGPTTTLKLTYEPAETSDIRPVYLNVSFDDELPEGGMEAVNEIYGLMMANTGNDRLIREYIEKN